MAWESGRLRTCDPNDTVTINVGGQLFTTRRSTLYRLPNSRLYLLLLNDAAATSSSPAPIGDAGHSIPQTELDCDFDNACTERLITKSDALNNNFRPRKQQSLRQLRHRHNIVDNSSDNSDYIFFDRDPEIFKFILDYYRTGELHLPHSLCGPFIRKELIFWGIPEEDIEPCCLSLYMKYEEERKTKNMLFRDCFEDIEPMKHLVHISRGFKRWRFKSWLFLDFPTSSLAAKIWAVALLLMMAVSIITYSLATHPDFRVERRFMRALDKSSNSSGDLNDRIPKQCRAYFNLSDKDKRENKDYRYDCTIPLPGLIILDIVLNGVFTCEVLVKTLISPDRSRYLRSPTTVLEIFISLSFWLQMLLTHVTSGHQEADADGALLLSIRTVIKINDPDESQENSAIQLLLAGCNMAQALRVFRISKLSKISSGLRVLMLTVKKSITELVLLGFLLINGMFLFACLIYLAEYNVKDTFPSIPNALWWSIITITGVGYGDVFPKGGLGYFVGALCAISGCTVTGLAIPIIGHNFNTYYKYMRNYLKESKYLRELRKERGACDIGSQERDQLSVVKRKLSRRRRGPHLHNHHERSNSHVAHPNCKPPALKSPTSLPSTPPIACTLGNSCAGNTSAITSTMGRKRQRPPLLKSHTVLALTADRPPIKSDGKSVCAGAEANNRDAVKSKLECELDLIVPLRTPKHQSPQSAACNDRDEPEDSETYCSSKLCCQHADYMQLNSTLGVGVGLEIQNGNSQFLQVERHKTLRKLMGNSFDRGVKRPVT